MGQLVQKVEQLVGHEYGVVDRQVAQQVQQEEQQELTVVLGVLC